MRSGSIIAQNVPPECRIVPAMICLRYGHPPPKNSTPSETTYESTYETQHQNGLFGVEHKSRWRDCFTLWAGREGAEKLIWKSEGGGEGMLVGIGRIGRYDGRGKERRRVWLGEGMSWKMRMNGENRAFGSGWKSGTRAYDELLS